MGIPQANKGPIVLLDNLGNDVILKYNDIVNQMQTNFEL